LTLSPLLLIEISGRSVSNHGIPLNRALRYQAVELRNKGNEMKIIDLSHMIHPEMPVYPGTEQPRIVKTNSHEKDGFAEKLLSMYSHTGTHMDAPFHILLGGKTLDQYDISKFAGKARVVQVKGNNGVIGIEELENVKADLEGLDYLLLKTGWSQYWGKGKYFEEFPVLSEEAAKLIAGSGLKGLGVDCISVDPADNFDLPVHRIILGADMVIIENLTNLEIMFQQEFVFMAMPLRLEEADGSPVRAIAMFD
jgi:arylformamidase